jgi:hypothetical protein
MKSKCEKAAWKYTKAIYGNTLYYEEEVVGDFEAFKKGAEALLRYAKSREKRVLVNPDDYMSCLCYEDLEEWFKGEK